MQHTTPTRLASALAAGLLVAGAAHAGVADPADDAYFPVILQESLLSGYDFEFVIHNCNEEASITGIYFEEGWDDYFSDSPFERNLRTDPGGQGFIEGNNNPDLAGWSSSLVSYEINNGGLAGLPSGGSATVAFVLDDDFSIDDVQSALFTDGFGIGLRVLGLEDDDVSSHVLLQNSQDLCGFFGDGEDEGDDGGDGGGSTGEPTGVPSPSAALLGLAMLGLAGRRRRSAA